MMLNELYNPHNICFELNGIKKFYKPELVFANSLDSIVNAGSLLDNNGDKIAFDDEAINVYVNGLNWTTYQWYGVSRYNKNFLAIRDYNINSSTAMVLAHEIGHSLNLIHTHGRTTNLPNINMSSERVTRDPDDPNYNAHISGDLVTDTDADPSFNSNINSTKYNYSSECKYIGNYLDYTGVPYTFSSDIAERNIMSYGKQECLDLFTPLQAERMHLAIESQPILQNCLSNSNTKQDLVIRNSEQDFGIVPDLISPELWVSPDIWVRNNPDNSLIHENPIYEPNSPKYVYVRIINTGCEKTTGTDKLRLNWSKAGTSLPLTVWEGEVSLNNQVMGGLIEEVTIPVLESNEETILEIEWFPPNPVNFTSDNEPWHFCLLGQIISEYEIDELPTNDGWGYLLRNTNNIALKNVSVINTSENENSASIFVGNFQKDTQSFKIKVKDISKALNSSIFENAEVILKLDDVLLKHWTKSNFAGTNLKIISKNEVLINKDSEIEFHEVSPNIFGKLTVKVHFLTQVNNTYDNFKFHLVQTSLNNEVIGGELFEVNKKIGKFFKSSIISGDQTLFAELINEPASYKWYDENGTLLHEGENYEIIENNKKYTLEVVSLIDGFKDYESISLNTENTTSISSIVPNPVLDVVNISINNLNCPTAYLMIVNTATSSSSNYILNNNLSLEINMSNYPTGHYTVVLVCNNEYIDSKHLIKN